MCIFNGRYKSVEPAEITLSGNFQCCFLKKKLNSRIINTHETHENDQHEHFPKKNCWKYYEKIVPGKFNITQNFTF